MAKKNIEQYLYDIKEMYVERELACVDKLLEGHEPDKDEEKFLRQLKGRINFVEKMYYKMTGKTGKEKSEAETELMGRIFEMKSSMGEIVRSAEKIGS